METQHLLCQPWAKRRRAPTLSRPRVVHHPLQHKYHRGRRHVAKARQHLARLSQRIRRQLQSLLDRIQN